MSTTVAFTNCGYCNGVHIGICPRVRSIEYHPNGAVKRVEFHDSATPPAARGES